MLMKKLLLLFSLIFMLACAPSRWATIGYSDISSSYKNIYNWEQMDSVCHAENIPSDLSKWISIQLKDYESSHKITRYTYMYKDSLVFVLEQDSTNYILNKRFVIK